MRESAIVKYLKSKRHDERSYMAIAVLDRKGRLVRWVDGWV